VPALAASHPVVFVFDSTIAITWHFSNVAAPVDSGSGWVRCCSLRARYGMVVALGMRASGARSRKLGGGSCWTMAFIHRSGALVSSANSSQWRIAHTLFLDMPA